MLLDRMKRTETSCWRVNVIVWRSADECFLKRCWSGLQTIVGMIWQWHVWKCVETVNFNCKCKLVLHLRLGYFKLFLAGSKKTRQGPGWRVGALCIGRCWFYFTVVAGRPKLIQKDYKIIWCCVILCYGSWWFKRLWYVNDEVKNVYEMIMKLVE